MPEETSPFPNIPSSIRSAYEIHEWRHAAAVLHSDFPSEWADLLYVLAHFKFTRSDILAGGGSKSRMARSIDQMFIARGWEEKEFAVDILVDGTPHPSPTHKVDYFKNRIAIETEWNNKDPFFDRDLNNFRLLHQLDVISAGVIITRADELQLLFKSLGKKVANKYGAATTHMGKLVPKITGGGAGGCPVLVFGISERRYDPNA